MLAAPWLCVDATAAIGVAQRVGLGKLRHLETQKSTSGACFMHGSHLIKAYSRTQANIALLSGEAEYYSMVKAASEGMGLSAMASG